MVDDRYQKARDEIQRALPHATVTIEHMTWKRSGKEVTVVSVDGATEEEYWTIAIPIAYRHNVLAKYVSQERG